MLPPVGWADVATKADLDARFAVLDTRFDLLEERLTARFHQEMNRQIWAMVGSLLALAAVLTANSIW